jgi:uncharacterized membrane protein
MKKNLFAGLAIVLPITLTILVLLFIVHLFTDPLLALAEKGILAIFPHLDPSFLPFAARCITLVLLVLGIFLFGVIAQWLFVRALIQEMHALIFRIPVVKTIYKVTKDIIHALLSKEGRKAFKQPVLVSFPSPQSSVAGLSSGEVPREIAEKFPYPLEPVFVPTAPHLISGFLIFFPKDKADPIEMTHQEFVKFVISCGILVREKSVKKN